MLTSKGPLNHALKNLAHLATGDETTTLGCVLLQAIDGELTITATDLTTWLRFTVRCEGDFSAVLPVKALLEFTKPSDKNDRTGLTEFMAVEGHLVVVAIEGAMITLPGKLTSSFSSIPEALTFRQKMSSPGMLVTHRVF